MFYLAAIIHVVSEHEVTSVEFRHNVFYFCYRLQHLSLKCCGVSADLLSALRLPLSENKALMFLDLSCNQVGDEGVRHLASALRMNRTLLSLALANNKIGDDGATLLAEVLTSHSLECLGCYETNN